MGGEGVEERDESWRWSEVEGGEEGKYSCLDLIKRR